MAKTSPTAVERDAETAVPDGPPGAAGGHPYRDAVAASPAAGAPSLGRGDLALGWALVALGLVPVLSTLLRGGPWGREPCVGLLLVAFAGRSLVGHYLRAPGRRG